MTAWLTDFAHPAKNAGARLICFPSSGSGSTLYRPWLREFDDLALHAVMLPGRERRMHEPPACSIDAVVNALLPAIATMADRPYFLFGHSMGAIIAFELTRALQRRGLRLPERLFVSAFRAPDRHDASRYPNNLSYDRFIDTLRAYGGTPEAVLENREIMQMLLPVLRADFALLGEYRYDTGDPLPVPISAFAGREDAAVPASEMADWCTQTSSGFNLTEFDGGHFFINSARTAVLQQIADCIRSDLAGNFAYG